MLQGNLQTNDTEYTHVDGISHGRPVETESTVAPQLSVMPAIETVPVTRSASLFVLYYGCLCREVNKPSIAGGVAT